MTKRSYNYCPTLARAIGSRIESVRKVKWPDGSPEKIAALFGMSADEWLAVEAGSETLDTCDLFAFCLRFRIASEFILYGETGTLEESLLDLVSFTVPSNKPASKFYHTYRLKSDEATVH